MPIEFNEKFKKSLDVMEKTSHNVFVTGRAGTGKSTLLQHFRATTAKKIAVLAPTGVAALNVRGQTIHSFFKFRPDITVAKAKDLAKHVKKPVLYRSIEALVIDEISMVRADLLDCMDVFLRTVRGFKNVPFGGVQMIFIGDLYQLPPVITGAEKKAFAGSYESPYFFSAHVFVEFQMDFIELEKIYRQKDQSFINILNSIRNNTAGDRELDFLNTRCDINFEPNSQDFYIYLTPTNIEAENINSIELAKVSGKQFVNVGIMQGNFGLGSLPTSVDLKLKVEAQVMLLNNDNRGRWVNGSVGKIKKINQNSGREVSEVMVQFQDGVEYIVEPYTWELFSYKYNVSLRSLETDVIGSFTQFPLKLAWAVTIHKSQGKTFEKVILDIGRGSFAHGQTYVALSRCTSLTGLVLKKPITKKHIFLDWRVVKFVTQYQYAISEAALSFDAKKKIIQEKIDTNGRLEIIYLKASDEKSKRIIKPLGMGEMEYQGKVFFGLRAFCCERNEERTFRVDRILEIL